MQAQKQSVGIHNPTTIPIPAQPNKNEAQGSNQKNNHKNINQGGLMTSAWSSYLICQFVSGWNFFVNFGREVF